MLIFYRASAQHNCAKKSTVADGP